MNAPTAAAKFLARVPAWTHGARRVPVPVPAPAPVFVPVSVSVPARAYRRDHGFSLVEVLVVLVIVGVLSAIALPAYVNYVVQARRVEGQVALLLLMQQQERYFSENNSYLAFNADATDPAARRFQWWSGSSAARSAYELTGQACAGQTIAACIELRATPGTDKVDSHFRDAACGALSLSSDGSYKAAGHFDHCWP